MRKLSLVFLVLSLTITSSLLLSLSFVPTAKADSTGPTLSILPASKTVPSSGQFSLKVNFTNFPTFTGWDISVKTNSDMLIPTAITLVETLGGTPFVLSCVNGVGTACGVGDGPGVAHSAVAAISGSDAGSGTLFTIIYNIVAGPDTIVAFINPSIVANQAAPILDCSLTPNQCLNGSVIVSMTPPFPGGTVVANVTVGHDPYDVAYDSGNGYVYVTNFLSNTVSVISGATVVATIPVCCGPTGVGYNSGNGYIYVANYYSSGTVPGTNASGTVSVISGTTVVATVSLGNSYPYAGGVARVAYDGGNGYIYVAMGGNTDCCPYRFHYSYTVSVISGTTVVANVRVGLEPWGVAYDSGSGYVYAATQGGVGLISGTTVVANITGLLLGGLAYDSGNGYVYGVGSNDLAVINGTTVVATVPLPDACDSVSAAYDGDNGYLYVTNNCGLNVDVINGTEVLGSIPVGFGSYNAAYDSGNGYVYATRYVASDTVSVISTTTGVPFDYSLSNNGPASITPGSSGSVTVTASLTAGSARPVTLSCVSPSLPSGISCGSFTVNPVTPTGSSDLTINVASSVAAGSYSFDITGSPLGPTTSPTTVSVTVTNPFDYSLSNNGPVRITQGSSGSVTITATLSAGTAQPVTLACSSPLPTGVTCGSFTVNQATPTASSDLTINVASSVAVGSYIVMVTGSPMGATTTATTVSVMITAIPFDYSLLNSGPASVAQGSSGSVTITTTLTAGTARSIALSCVATSLPVGASCSFNPSSLTPSSTGATSKLTVYTTSSTPTGSFQVQVTGTSPDMTRTTTFALTLTAAPSATANIPGVDPTVYYAILGGILVLVAIVGATFALRKRKSSHRKRDRIP